MQDATDAEEHLRKFLRPGVQALFYSAPSFFEVFRNLVREIWFEKSGSRKLVLQSQFFSGF
jgi:hypothetical protein